MYAAGQPFRILLIDDELDLAIEEPAATSRRFDERILHALVDLQNVARLEVWGTRTLAFEDDRGVFRRFLPKPTSETHTVTRFLKSIDVVVLDLRGLKLEKGFDSVSVAEVHAVFEAFGLTPPEVSEASLRKVSTELGGVGFFYRRFEQLRDCQAILILSEQDGRGSFAEVGMLIDQLCVDSSPVAQVPWIAKYSKTASLDELILSLSNLCTDWAAGYENLAHRGAIEFAASNDLPVLVVGESGTGKEYIARAIHSAWCRRKLTEERAAAIPFVVVNCAALVGELARSELFGHTAGSIAGAAGHNLGAILRACGCRNLTTKLAETDKGLQDAARKLQRELDNLPTFKNADTPAKMAQGLHEFITAANQLINPLNRNHGLPEILRAAQRRLAELIEGRDIAAEFRTQLLENQPGLFHVEAETDGFDLRFQGAGYRGTLFLDEFGHLPVVVQALLLRFLDDRLGEIQPVGYPGTIRGLKVRIIAATNDHRVACMAGVPDYPHRPVPGAEPTHSILQDLTQRIRQIVIRAAPVTAKNAEAFLRRITSAEVVWSEAAIKEVVQFVRKHQQSPIFGHRRELKRIVSLTEAYVTTANARGLRGFEHDGQSRATIRLQDVRRFLAAAIEIDPDQAQGPSGPTRHLTATSRADELLAGGWNLRARVEQERARLIESFGNIGVSLPEDFNWKNLWTIANQRQKAKETRATLLEWHNAVSERSEQKAKLYKEVFRSTNMLGTFTQTITSTTDDKLPRFGLAKR